MTRMKSYANVWDAIEPDPVVRENLKLRSVLMSELTRHIERQRLTQAEAAKLFGVSQPRVSNLVRGKIDAFSLDLLANMAAAAGLHVTMKVRRAA